MGNLPEIKSILSYLILSYCSGNLSYCKNCRIKQGPLSQGPLAETTLLPCLSSYTG